MKPSVLFVCMGNICRSPTGEGVLQSLAEQRGIASQLHIDSAGTIGYHTGNPADRRMRAAASQRGYALNSRARQVKLDDLLEFDLVIAMDSDNLHDLRRLAESAGDALKAELKMLSDFLDDKWPVDVPDPYYGGADGFEFVLDMIEAACPAILERLGARGQ
ncbi:MAG: low molecular weight phosphotyrosine protein phosphatase [Planctomycetales bacterium]|nr:low molecular weight phosphotyrosine protein phosphatase [Planctomycetales bacterium]